MKAKLPLVLASAAIICSILLQAQSHEPSLEETENWISEKVLYYSYKGEGVTSSNKISFAVGGMRLGLMSWIYSSSIDGQPLRDLYGTIKISQIRKIYFQKKEYNTWLVIQLVDQFDPQLNTCSTGSINKEGKAYFILNNEVENENMKNRLIKAFAALVRFNGGSLEEHREAY